MQFIDLQRQFDRIEADIRTGMDAVYRHQQFIMGPEVKELEHALAGYTRSRHVISCANGTDALVLVLMAMGLEKTDAVFVPSFTFFATAESVTLAGGTPVFVDADPDTFNMCPDALQRAIQATLKKGELKPRGVMPVDLFGLTADYSQIIPIAKKYGMFVLEDGAQGFGGTCGGSKACSFGHAATTSFFPAKPLGCYGDGGAIFTDDDALADRLRSIRVHGKGSDKYDNVRIGQNSRLDTMQAVVLLAKLKVFDDEMDARNRVAAAYTAALQGVIKTPVVPEGSTSAWAQYTLVAQSNAHREEIISGLKAQGIPAMVYYPKPVHLSTAYSDMGYGEGSLPVCEDLSRRVVSLPMHPYLTDEEISRVSKAVIALCAAR